VYLPYAERQKRRSTFLGYRNIWLGSAFRFTITADIRPSFQKSPTPKPLAGVGTVIPCFRCFPVAATYFHLQAIVQQIFPGLAHRITGLRPLPEDSFAGVADPVCTSNRAVCYVEFRHVVFRVFRTFAEAHVRWLLCSAPSGKGHAPEAFEVARSVFHR